MAETLKAVSPWIGSATLGFPGREDQGDLMCERLAWDLETPKILSRFIDELFVHVSGFDAVGLPPVFGLYRFEQLRKTLEKALGKPVFEIPGLAPSLPGMRIKEGFASRIQDHGVQRFSGRVNRVTMDSLGRFCFKVTQGMDSWQIRANTLVLATGRFLGQGLGVNQEGRIKEPLFDLPVTQTDQRSQWLNPDFFNGQGHPVNRAGIETDEFFRPLDGKGKVFHPGLYTVGTIIAYQDWKREKSGSGISISMAYKAVSHLLSSLENRS
ncbi:MAG: FAD-binding protein [Desulfobacter sp.]|nr:MAG: FAD-binding protein [Desulfobacter sp.]